MDVCVISVIITTYNHEKYILQAVESITTQKECPPYEIIIGEDCSTDETRSIIEDYIKKTNDNRIRLLKHTDNMGLQKNLKVCIDSCRGGYIAICEGDDYWVDEYKLKKQYEMLLKNPGTAMCFSDIRLLFEDGTTREHFAEKQKELPEIITAREMILYHCPSATFSCCMYTAQAVMAVPHVWFERNDVFDWLFNLFVLEHGTGIFLKTVCVYYRITNNGLWSGKNEKEKKNESIIGSCIYNKLLDYKYSEYFYDLILRMLGGVVPGKDIFRDFFSVKIPCPKKKILKISVQGGRKG